MEKEVNPLLERREGETVAQFHSRLTLEDEKEHQAGIAKRKLELEVRAVKEKELANEIMKRNG